MIGHTGNLSATIQAIETIDKSITNLYEAVNQASGTLLITADHGNAEYMLDNQQNPCKSHTTNLVPFILIEGEQQKIIGHGGKVILKPTGCLADIAPTILDILNISQPPEMTGQTLIQAPKHEIRNTINISHNCDYNIE
jgi:2,3-bisphosphoglycerate-independent phosphoglycerate mutase